MDEEKKGKRLGQMTLFFSVLSWSTSVQAKSIKKASSLFTFRLGVLQDTPKNKQTTQISTTTFGGLCPRQWKTLAQPPLNI